MSKRLWSVFIILTLLAGTLALAEDPAPLEGKWYEIFVYSFSDSDGDGIGDLNGLRNKLDYLEYLGVDGIWLMPVSPSPSYHKYDVTDYMDIDPQYGTLDDMRALVSDCHARGIRVITDLVLNHTSTKHRWFTMACSALRMSNPSNRYVGYYNFYESAAPNRVNLFGTDWYYEEQFSGGSMPDLNLLNPLVRQEIRSIMEFWLTDIGVDGFRLDAVTSYGRDINENIEILSWINDTAKEIKPSCYIVGEAWTSLDQIARYYDSGIDSFFLFPASQAEGYIAGALNAAKPARTYVKYLLLAESKINGIIAPFLGNHDTARILGILNASSDPALLKFAHGIINMFPGSVFTYYGDEIGMSGSGNDPNKRIAMNWSEEERTIDPPGVTRARYSYPGVYEQMQDENSPLNYFRQINALKKAYPVIMTGRSQEVFLADKSCVIQRALGDDTLYIAINFDPAKTAEIPLEGNYTLAGTLLANGGEVTLESDGRLTMPPYGIALLSGQK
ncbi:MAG: alpha-amylase [Clostridiales bacterium]|nr:alpha-amylase [Clostridiales bacterium]